MPGSYRAVRWNFRARALFALGAVHGVAALVLAGLIGLVVLATGAPDHHATPWTLVAILVVGPLVRAVWNSGPVEAPLVLAPAGGVAGLQAFVERTAKTAGLPGEHEVRLTLDNRVAVERHHGRPVLVIGAPRLAISPAETLAAAITIALVRDAGHLRRAVVHLRRRLENIDAYLGHSWGPFALWRDTAGGLIRPLTRLLDAHEDAVAREVQSRLGVRAVTEARHEQALESLFVTYWDGDVRPCLDAGFAPPVVAGWPGYSTRGQDEPEDVVPAGFADAADWKAVEAELLGRRPGGATLVPIGWDRVAEAVWLPQLREQGDMVLPMLVGKTVTGLADLPLDELAPHAVGRVGAALAVVMHEAGWELATAPGRPVTAHFAGDLTVNPIDAVFALQSHVRARATWTDDVEALGIADLVFEMAQEPVGLEAALAQAISEQAVDVELVASPGAQRRHRRRAVEWSLVGAVCAVLVGSMQLVGTELGMPAAGRVLLGGVALAIIVATVRFVAGQLRLANARGTLTIGLDTVQLVLPGLLHEPWRVPRALVRTVAVDDADDRRDPDGRQVRFLWRDASWVHAATSTGAVGALWTEEGGPVIPMAASPREMPNLVLVFGEPVAAPRTRGKGPTLPLPGQAIGGLMLRAADTTALERSGVLAELTDRDVRLLVAAEPGALV